MSVELATPAAALVILIAVVPLAVTFIRSRGARRLRRELGLAEPRARTRLARPLALACAFTLLGLAAAQPSLVRDRKRLVRTDAQMLVVLDTSRSMLASSAPQSPPRYRRAAAFALALHRAIPELPAGVASLNNRLLPYLFPTADQHAFDVVVRQAYGIQQPRPAVDPDPQATDFDQLGTVTTHQFFSPEARKRFLVVLSDAETRPFGERAMLASLRRTGTTPIVVRFWRRGERIYDGAPADAGYHSTQADELDRLRAAGWPAYSEREAGAAVHKIEAVLGSGPVAQLGYQRQEISLAPALALAALAPLLLLFVPARRLPSLRRRQAPAGAEPTAAK